MNRIWVVVGVAALLTAGVTVWAASHKGSLACSSTAGAAGAESCAPGGGEVAGHYDAAMSGMCRFSCATKLDYQPGDVVAQPGAVSGRLTRCPVSGVVFAVEADSPHVLLASGDYVVCCDICAGKLEKDPGRFLKL